MHPSRYSARVLISGYHADIKYKTRVFYFKAISRVNRYHDGTQNFAMEKFDILAFKWRTLGIFRVPRSQVIPKKKGRW